MAETAQGRRTDTKERLMDVAEASILEKGFGATSIEELIAEVGITKGGFFYHFADKGVLAKMYVLRRILMPMGATDAMEFLIDKLKHSKSNKDFFEAMNT